MRRGLLVVLNPLFMQLAPAVGHQGDCWELEALHSFQLLTKRSLRKCCCSGVFQPIGGAVGPWEVLCCWKMEGTMPGCSSSAGPVVGGGKHSALCQN